MPIDQVRKSYDAAIGEMKEKFPTNDPSATEFLINGAMEGFQPFSLDIIWQRRLEVERARFATDMSLMESKDDLLKAGDSIAKQNLGAALNTWLVEADPFQEKPDPDKIAERGAELLAAIKKCFDLAAAGGEHAEAILANLVVIADAVRERLSGFETGKHVDKAGKVLDAGAVRQMYAELLKAINDSSVADLKLVRESISTNPRERDRLMRDSWPQKLEHAIDDVKKNPENPAFPWSSASEQVLGNLNGDTKPTRADLEKLLARRKFRDQINRLNQAFRGGSKTKGYVMKVREAAWAVQDTLGEYRRGIDSLWRPDGGEMRQSLELNLFALDDWLKNQVFFVINAVLAKGGGRTAPNRTQLANGVPQVKPPAYCPREDRQGPWESARASSSTRTSTRRTCSWRMCY